MAGDANVRTEAGALSGRVRDGSELESADPRPRHTISSRCDQPWNNLSRGRDGRSRAIGQTPGARHEHGRRSSLESSTSLQATG